MIKVTVQIDPAYESEIDRTRLSAVVESTLHICDIVSAELTVVITSDEVVCELNRQYRNIDSSTDVLSFETSEATPDADDFVLPLNVMFYIGDVVISFPTAVKQAAIAGHAFFDEILLLAIHGTLHLLHFDHHAPVEKAKMWQRQAEILQLNNLTHVTPTE